MKNTNMTFEEAVVPQGEPVEPIIDADIPQTPSDVEGPVLHRANAEVTSATAAPRRRNTPTLKTAPPRSFDECVQLPVNKLTDKEKNLLIEELKSRYKREADRAVAFESNAKSAYDQARQLSDINAKIQIEANQKLAFINQTVSVFAQTILMTTRGEK